MGQGNSKGSSEDHRSAPTAASPTSPSPANTFTDVTNPPSSSLDVTSVPTPDIPTNRSRRSTFSKSLLSHVKPRASTSRSDFMRNRVDSSVSSSTLPSSFSSLRRWGAPRRWSRTRESSDLVQSSIDASPQPEVVGPPVTPPQDLGKGKARADEVDSDVVTEPVENPSSSTGPSITAERPPTPFPCASADAEAFPAGSSSASTAADIYGLTKEESEASRNIGSWLSGQNTVQGSAASLSHRPTLGLQEGVIEDTVVISPQLTEDFRDINDPTFHEVPDPASEFTTPSAPPPIPTDTTDPTANPSLPPRQFPPPGTLVVVQGVVHTTDVPRHLPPPDVPISRSNVSLPHPNLQRRASSTPRPSTPVTGERIGNSARNRLSALIPRSRHTSMLPRTAPQEDTVHTTTESPGPPPRYDADSAAPETQVPSATATTTENREGPPSGAVSSSSIDVLGTLLSVAAAATAASLLTGSSEPIFNSGLAPPTSANGNLNLPTSPVPHSIPRPMAPTPATSFPFGFGHPVADTAPSPEPTATRGRDRVRNVWGSLRERFGLRSSNPPPPPPPNESSSSTRTRTDGTPVDAREAMLAEMARAFNLGLGLGSDAAGAANPPGDGPGAGADAGGQPSQPSHRQRTLPPEDSFERFLIDLQSELRIALSQSPSGENTPQPTPADINPDPPLPSAPPLDPVQPATSTGASEASRPGDMSDSEGEEDDDSVQGGHSSTTTDSDMPPLLDNSSNPAFPFIPHPSSSAAGANFGQGEAPRPPPIGSASHTEHRPGGGINWWRLYRFPPISAPHAQGLSAALNNTSPANPTAPAPTPDVLTDGPATPGESANMSSAHAPPPPQPTPATEARPNIVVPVIVVGLQSVNLVHRREQRASEDEEVGGGESEMDGVEEDLDLDALPHPPPENDSVPQEPQQGRSWHTRAADAIRNLRPGRRAAPQEAPPGDTPGSRTFLIYVIGGYYPPDHHIVTGINSFDTFEALWELAEILGQGKPPTVSKEDIDKSGLKILKPAALVQYEKDGKVSSNCTEKCLICLDEYEPEDDVRLLNCRHAFHMDCVDKWLQTGRNNCPACRSKGVFTDGNVASQNPQAPTEAPA